MDPDPKSCALNKQTNKKILSTAFNRSITNPIYIALLLFPGLEQLYSMLGRLEHLQPEKASKFISHPQAGNLTTGFTADLTIPVHSQTTQEVPAKKRRTSPSTDNEIPLQQGKTSTPPPPPRTILKLPPPIEFYSSPFTIFQVQYKPSFTSVSFCRLFIHIGEQPLDTTPANTYKDTRVHPRLLISSHLEQLYFCDEQLQKI